MAHTEHQQHTKQCNYKPNKTTHTIKQHHKFGNPPGHDAKCHWSSMQVYDISVAFSATVGISVTFGIITVTLVGRGSNVGMKTGRKS